MPGWEEKVGLAFIVAVCLVFSFLLSGMEAGVFALSRFRVRQQMRTGKAGAQMLHRYLENPEDFLWTILIGNTLATFIALSILVIELHGMLAGNQLIFALVFFSVTFLFYAFFDLLPKMLFRMFPNRLCLIAAAPFRLIHFVLAPFVSILRCISDYFLRMTGGKSFTGHLFASRSELRQVMQETANTLSSDERLMINRVLDLQNATVKSILVPLHKVASVPAQSPGHELLRLGREKGLTRIPVWQGEGASRRIIGIVSLQNALYSEEFDPSQPVGKYVTPALYLREDLKLEEALRRMQRSGQRLAIVLGLNQREIGVVSLEDVLKSIFGEVNL